MKADAPWLTAVAIPAGRSPTENRWPYYAKKLRGFFGLQEEHRLVHASQQNVPHVTGALALPRIECDSDDLKVAGFAR